MIDYALSWPFYVTRMLMRDLFAVANIHSLSLSGCGHYNMSLMQD